MSCPHVDIECPHAVGEVVEYEKVLLKSGITCIHRDPWLEVGDCSDTGNWLLYISALSQYVGKIIHEVAPLLYAYHVPFKLLKNSKLVDSSNGLGMGMKEAGKVLVIYPSSEKQAVMLAGELERITTEYEGILIENCVRVGKVLYATHTRQSAGNIPFNIPKLYRIRKRKGIIGRYYVPIRLIKYSPKGDINLGVSMKGFSFTPCIIKQARAGSFVDKSGRRSFHRLQWQKSVLEALKDKLPVPGVLDFCRKGNDHFLIIEYIEGTNLSAKVMQLHNQLPWKDLPVAAKKEMLHYFTQIAEIVNVLHEHGYLHRDIQIDNFIIRDNKVHVIDFELAYYMPAQAPSPAFGYGTAGFVSPQQRSSQVPSPSEDVFSLGAVLAYIILNPLTMQEFSGNIYEALVGAGAEERLLDIIVRCMAEEPAERPSITEIIRLLK